MLLRKIKLLCALGLLLCMFLPLSQCGSEAVMGRPATTVTYYIIDIQALPQSVAQLLPAFVFTTPAFLMLFTLWGKREKLRHEILDVIAGALIIGFLSIYLYFSQFLYGAYLSMSLAAVFMLSSVGESIGTIRARGGIFRPDPEDAAA